MVLKTAPSMQQQLPPFTDRFKDALVPAKEIPRVFVIRGHW